MPSGCVQLQFDQQSFVSSNRRLKQSFTKVNWQLYKRSGEGNILSSFQAMVTASKWGPDDVIGILIFKLKGFCP